VGYGCTPEGLAGVRHCKKEDGVVIAEAARIRLILSEAVRHPPVVSVPVFDEVIRSAEGVRHLGEPNQGVVDGVVRHGGGVATEINRARRGQRDAVGLIGRIPL
jgi:hypothetical protein